VLVARLLLLLLVTLLVAACGREAPPRAAKSTPFPTSAPTHPAQLAQSSQPADTAQATGDPRALGDPNAPITVIEYSDYQCPYCSTFVHETKSQLEEQYIKTGKVYFVYRDFPLVDIHPAALLATHVANCAAAQGSFWPMHDRLFAGTWAREWGSGGERDFKLFLGYAQDLKLDVAAIQSCVEAQWYAFQVDTDMRQAAQRGVRSTPTFLVNGRPFVGAQPYDAWKQVLDDLLAHQ